MFVYQNLSRVVKTFHGVTFNPGDIKEVPGYINDSKFIKLDKMPDKKQDKKSDKKPDTAKKEVTDNLDTKN